MRYLLVEHDGDPTASGFEALDIPADVRAAIASAATRADARVLLIRRPRRHESPVCLLRSWCVVDPHAPPGHRIRWGAWAYPADLRGGIDRLDELVEPSGLTDQPAGPDDPLILVCTDPWHDTDCSVAGRSVASRLAGRWPEPTWACTRPVDDVNPVEVLLLPSGETIGGLDAESALEAVESRLGDARSPR